MSARWVLALVAGLALAALPGLAPAQQVTLERSAALACLTHQTPGSLPDYPFAAFKLEQSGEVRVELVFDGPEREPQLKLLDASGSSDHAADFVQAVKRHVRGLRLPCMRPGEAPVRLEQAYSFAPDRRRAVTDETVDPLDEQRQRLLRCVKHESAGEPGYPDTAREKEIQGRVLARLRFDAPDQPPQAEVYARRSAVLLRREIESWVRGYRMPCHQGGSVSGLWLFEFRLGSDAYGFKPLTLLELMGAVRDIRQQTLSFDTTQMNCPFDLRLRYGRLALPNAVTEVLTGGQRAADPARRALMRWLEGVELALPAESLDRVFGDTALVTVPCVKIDLKPKE